MKRLTLPMNKHGRDFVCGDLHGCLERVAKFLSHVSFDQTRDRLISVGDLVDRGPENEDCLRLLKQPWFFAVQGNHEMLMSHFYYPELGPYGGVWGFNGGGWGMSYGLDNSLLGKEIRNLAKQANELPLLITVPMANGKKFHVIHAELSATEELTDDDLMDDEKFKEAAFAQTMDGDFILWGRFIFYNLYRKHLDNRTIEKFRRGAELHKMGRMFGQNLSHIYSGHTIVTQPVRYKGQTNLDTCAYGSYDSDASGWEGLTVTEPLTDRFWHVNATGVSDSQVVIL